MEDPPDAWVGRLAAVGARTFGPQHDPWPEHRAAFAGGVSGLRDVIFAALPGFRPLLLDLYLPPGAGPHPLIVYVHGGGWMSGTKRASAAFADWPAVLASVAAEGFVVAAVSYRLSGEARFPAALHDVRTAIRWLRANAARFGIDASRVALWGASAGGQLAALAALAGAAPGLMPDFAMPAAYPTAEQPHALPADLAAQSDAVRAVALWYGVFDFAAMPRKGADSPEARFLGTENGAVPAATQRLASPITYVAPGAPPFLLIHGEADAIVPAEQSRSFHARLREAGVAADLLLLPGIDHSFLGGAPEETGATSRRMLARTVEFLRSALHAG
jgi:acetyl esterase/lipase